MDGLRLSSLLLLLLNTAAAACSQVGSCILSTRQSFEIVGGDVIVVVGERGVTVADSGVGRLTLRSGWWGVSIESRDDVEMTGSGVVKLSSLLLLPNTMTAACSHVGTCIFAIWRILLSASFGVFLQLMGCDRKRVASFGVPWCIMKCACAHVAL